MKHALHSLQLIPLPLYTIILDSLGRLSKFINQQHTQHRGGEKCPKGRRHGTEYHHLAVRLVGELDLVRH